MTQQFNPTTDTTQQQAVRRPEGQIRLLFEKFQAFVDEYRPKISLGGVFIATNQPREVGSTITCEFKLADGFRLCHVQGDVLWVRPQETAPDRPAGMGIRFQSIDDDGRKLILKILEEQLKAGGEPFEVERIPADAVLSSVSELPMPQEDSASIHPREVQLPAPKEDPASTRPRLATPQEPIEPIAVSPPAVSPPAVSPPAVSPPAVSPPTVSPPDEAGFEGFDAIDPIKPLSEIPTGPVGEDGEDDEVDFNAPWGAKLPGVPAEVIEPMEGVDDGAMDAPDELSFSDDALSQVQPVPELGPVTVPDFGAPSPEPIQAEAPEFEFEILDDMDEPELPAPGLPVPDLPAPALPEPTFSELSAPEPQFPEPAPVEPTTPDLGLPEPMPSFDDTLTAQFPDEGVGVPEPPMAPEFETPTAGPAMVGESGEFAEPPEDVWQQPESGSEWDQEEAESGAKRFFQDLRLTLSEAKGKILAVLVLLALVSAGFVFKEQLLALVGRDSTPATKSAAAGQDPIVRDHPTDSGNDGSSPATGPSRDPSPVAGSEPSSGAGSDRPSDQTEPATADAPSEADITPQPLPPPAAQPPNISRSQDPQSQTSGGVLATRLRDISFKQTTDGTEVTVLLDGEIAADRYVHNPLGYDPRKEQVSLLGIEAIHQSQTEVGTLELMKVRSGRHADRVNLVFDFSSGDMTISSIQVRGDRLVIVVSRKP